LSHVTGYEYVSQFSPMAAQFTHIAPLDPHSVARVPAWQLFIASQQPVQTALHGQVPPPVMPNPVWQVPLPSQQPSGHVVGPHTKPPQTPPLQKLVPGQLTHWFPPKPQSLFAVPVWQVLLASQQPKQLLGLQGVALHFPASHNWLKLHCEQSLPPDPQSKV
jgi:hypothetical protein